VARIDLDARSADFLITPARGHLVLVGIGGLLIVFLNIVSERHSRIAARAQQRQIELEHLAHMGEMSAVLAHEIRNPLGTIKGFAQLLVERESKSASLVHPILQQSERLENLVKDLLLYGRPVASPAWQIVDSAQIAGLVELHATKLAGPVDFRAAVLSPFVLETDPSMVEQVLLNLLRNAVEAAGSNPDGEARSGQPVVRFDASIIHGSMAVLRMTDNGPGFSDEALARMYEPFFTSKAAGTGLGLCITKKLVTALGGSLRVGNSASGAFAEVTLPLAREVR
jgi:two-component system sensor histidine kinase HydH